VVSERIALTSERLALVSERIALVSERLAVVSGRLALVSERFSVVPQRFYVSCSRRTTGPGAAGGRGVEAGTIRRAPSTSNVTPPQGPIAATELFAAALRRALRATCQRG
jgi:hypothetical protein